MKQLYSTPNILRLISSFLSDKQVKELSLTCKTFYEKIWNSDERYWKMKCMKKTRCDDKRPDETWISFYFRKKNSLYVFGKYMTDDVKHVSVGSTYMGVVKYSGEWEISDLSMRSIPIEKVIKRVKELTCKGGHILILTEEYKLYGMGSNDCGQLGSTTMSD